MSERLSVPVYTPIVGSLGYILSPDRTKVLMVQRTRPHDAQVGKYNGLGGKMLPSEDIATCMTREIQEEAGIVVTSMTLRGTINWTNFGPKHEDWLAFIFLIDAFTGTARQSNEEGLLSWIAIDQLNQYPMWPGDCLFLPLVFDNNPAPFHGVMPYNGNEVDAAGWKYTRLPV